MKQKIVTHQLSFQPWYDSTWESIEASNSVETQLELKEANNLSFSDDGNFCGLCLRNGSIELWDIRSLTVPMTLLRLPILDPNMSNMCMFAHAISWSQGSSHLCTVHGRLSGPDELYVEDRYVVTWHVASQSIVSIWK